MLSKRLREAAALFGIPPLDQTQAASAATWASLIADALETTRSVAYPSVLAVGLNS